MYFGGQMAGALSPSIMGFIITTFNGSYRAAFIFLMVALIIPIITACTLHTKEKDTGEMKINGALNEA
jgi:MFS-type transporter involved in bile tolerance (Atg22 family)